LSTLHSSGDPVSGMKRAHYDISDTFDTSPHLKDGVGHVSLMDGSDGAAAGTSKRLPKVSKKIQACTECQRRKIKCDLCEGEAACSRCRKRGFQCVVNKNLQSILEDDVEWKSRMEYTSGQLQTAISEILHNMAMPALESFPSTMPDVQSQQSYQSGSSYEELKRRIRVPERSEVLSREGRRSNQSTRMAMTRENSQERSGLGEAVGDAIIAAPMRSLYEVTKLRNLRSNPREYLPHGTTTRLEDDDFISRGEISIEEAEEMFQIFDRSLNQYLWGGMVLVHQDLQSVRHSSSLLLAAILTVTALHIPGKSSTFDICYAEFLYLVSDSMLDRYHTLDGIRGLCIGAFWLSDVSWKLSGHAVRIATELNLHRSYTRAIKGSQEHFEGARLWYLLYVCDHHFSIAYGRPPVIQDEMSIVQHEKFLQLPGITQADFRLHSQVAIFIILTQIYNTFGPEVEQMLDEDDLSRLRQWNIEIDRWRVKWEPQLAPNPHISSYPSKGVNLHYHFAKLQLNSLSLRGSQQLSSQNISAARREHANLAISCAMSILQLVIDEPDIRDALIGVPLYLHTMITYAAVFLLKVPQQWKAARLGTDSVLIRESVDHVIKLFNLEGASERHLSYHIARGLGKMLGRLDREAQADLAPQGDGSLGNINQVSAVSGFQVLDAGQDFGTNYPSLAMYGDSPEMFDENFFPIGFFDITNGGPWQWQPGSM
ncbi:Zn(2)-C6 zinc finger-containing prtT, partial [Hyphodiscus hymeniophilus]